MTDVRIVKFHLTLYKYIVCDGKPNLAIYVLTLNNPIVKTRCGLSIRPLCTGFDYYPRRRSPDLFSFMMLTREIYAALTICQKNSRRITMCKQLKRAKLTEWSFKEETTMQQHMKYFENPKKTGGVDGTSPVVPV